MKSGARNQERALQRDREGRRDCHDGRCGRRHACDSVRRDAGVSEVRQACAGLASLATCPRQAQCRQACALKTTAHLTKIPLEKSAPARRSRVLAYVWSHYVKIRWRLQSTGTDTHLSSHSESRSARTDVCEGRVIAPPVLLRRACALQAAGLVTQLLLWQQNRAQQRTRSRHDYVRERVRFT